MQPELPKLFGILPKTKVVVMPVEAFREKHRAESAEALVRLKAAAASPDANVFAVLMDAARVCTLQQVTEAFFEVGGQYRRNV